MPKSYLQHLVNLSDFSSLKRYYSNESTLLSNHGRAHEKNTANSLILLFTNFEQYLMIALYREVTWGPQATRVRDKKTRTLVQF